PLSALPGADVIAVLGDAPVVDRAPIVDLWLRQAKRNGARVVYELDEEAVRSSENAILIWSGPDGSGGAKVAAVAQRLGAAGAFYLPETANARGVCDAWAAAADGEPTNPDPIGLLIVSGDEAAANPVVRALAGLPRRSRPRPSPLGRKVCDSSATARSSPGPPSSARPSSASSGRRPRSSSRSRTPAHTTSGRATK